MSVSRVRISQSTDNLPERVYRLPPVRCPRSGAMVRPNDPARLAAVLLADETCGWRWSGARDRRWRRPECDYGSLLTASEAESRCWRDVLEVLSADTHEASDFFPDRKFCRPLVSRELVRSTLRVMEALATSGGSR